MSNASLGIPAYRRHAVWLALRRLRLARQRRRRRIETSHSANVVAKSRVKLLAIARADYDDLIRDGVTAAYKLAYNVVARVAKRLRTMDERVAAMAAHSDQEGADKRPDWHQFRENLFGEWNL